MKAAGHVISPPLRSKPHQLALRNALAGGILQLVGTGGAAMTGYSAMIVPVCFRQSAGWLAQNRPVQLAEQHSCCDQLPASLSSFVHRAGFLKQ